MKFMNKEKKNYTFIIGLAVYFIAGLLFLQKFPFMHSDESWLSGLTRTMMHSGLDSTETFFDLLPRYPHAIKTLFHLVQMPFILIFGYNLFAVRLVSLIFSCAAIYIIYKIAYSFSQSKNFSDIAAVAVAFDVQFKYASHFARQEIIIAFGMLLAIYYIYKSIASWSLKNDVIAGAIVGLMIGIHPNSFIAALSVGSIYLYYIIVDKKITFKNLFTLIGVVSLFAAIFVGVSYIFDGQFISHYLKYGDHLGVTQTFGEKVQSIVPFYQKLWMGISGTYYTPWIKIQLVLFGVTIIGAAIYAHWNKQVLLFIFPIIAVNVGYIVIGRYSQPSILLMFIVCWMLVIFLLSRIKKFKTVVSAILAFAMLVSSAMQISPYINDDYKQYLKSINDSVPQDARVLANLNAEYAFSYDRLYDYRNLGYLDDNELSFKDYVKSNHIEYIIYPEEMDYIYESRPVWNIVYGNIYPYYDDMKIYLGNECEIVSEFTSPYAMRIVKFAGDKEWSVTIYKVLK